MSWCDIWERSFLCSLIKCSSTFKISTANNFIYVFSSKWSWRCKQRAVQFKELQSILSIQRAVLCSSCGVCRVGTKQILLLGYNLGYYPAWALSVIKTERAVVFLQGVCVAVKRRQLSQGNPTRARRSRWALCWELRPGFILRWTCTTSIWELQAPQIPACCSAAAGAVGTAVYLAAGTAPRDSAKQQFSGGKIPFFQCWRRYLRWSA